MSMIGKTLAHYQITSQLGKGGMGEVYQAKDQKLGRDVAIKVLPEEFARDPERVGRFEREAKLLASLNHPNIAAIHGLEEAEGTHFLVLELVEGDTLADQLKHGAIPVEDSLKLALQIAEALEAAHEKGIIHRDLKPANIKITPDEKVKVLDFGLAKAFAAEQADLNLSNSPTLSNAATQQGVILGTAAYMSPEQGRGKSVDKRADIWAFGAVLYEMLTGRVAFRGEDTSEILASVIKEDVKLDLLPANLHPRVREILIRCLQRDLNRRYQDIRDARYEIEQALADRGGVFMQPVTTVEPRKKLRMMVPWLAAAVAMTAIITGILIWRLKPALPNEPKHVTRLSRELPQNQQFSNLSERAIAVSPDGRHLVYCTNTGLYVHSMDELNPRLVPGTAGAQNPFFISNGQWIGYWSATDKIMQKVSVSGGAPLLLTDVAPLGYIGVGVDEALVFGQAGKGIVRVPEPRGTPELLIKAEGREIFSPQILPDGESILFTQMETTTQAKIMARSLKSRIGKELFTGDTAYYLSTGHIVYALENNLIAIPFNPDNLEPTGVPIRIVEGVFRSGAAPQYAVSDSGTLAYIQSGSALNIQRTLVWVDRNGNEESLEAESNPYWSVKISPDGTQVALVILKDLEFDVRDANIWRWDMVRKTLTSVTSDPTSDITPIWTLDGKRIVYGNHHGTDLSIYRKAADGSGETELLCSGGGMRLLPWSWSNDGKVLVMEKRSPTGTNRDIVALSMNGDRKLKPLLQDRDLECHPQVSPDGRWLAYASDRSGKYEVYVRPFPDVSGGPWRVSTDGGAYPLWSPDRQELFYRNEDAVMVVTWEADAAFKPGKPEILFRKFAPPASVDNPWDISPDGKRFLMIKETASGESATESPRKINVVLNWFEELKRVPASK